jgi:hypothetical protein
LLGLVSSYLTYEDIAVSLQTNKPRISFQENSGLASVLPVDFIDEAISAYLAAFPTAPPVEPEIAPPVEEVPSTKRDTAPSTETKTDETAKVEVGPAD